ncbi:DUF3679 domain-containing protein [Ammoniphilus sp. 3BR4]|uniref:DUF3679 domain-containing protein n=1 Tax=Ammoniphilus sp. 3BR4 TaxID=3158265 RepID=UPI003466E631
MKWRIQFILLVMVMSCLVIGGIHLAEKGIQRVEGTEDGPAQSFHIARVDQGKMEMTVLGKQYSLSSQNTILEESLPQSPVSSGSHDRSIENWASSMGNHVGRWMTSATQELMDWVMD